MRLNDSISPSQKSRYNKKQASTSNKSKAIPVRQGHESVSSKAQVQILVPTNRKNIP